MSLDVLSRAASISSGDVPSEGPMPGADTATPESELPGPAPLSWPDDPPAGHGADQTMPAGDAAAPRTAESAGELSLLSTLAHELRGPLHALGVSASLLAAGVHELDAEQIRHMAHTIHQRTLWLQGTVENLLCAATIERGPLNIRPEPVGLEEIVAEVHLVVEPLLAHRAQRLHLDAPEGIALVLADRRRIGQALMNLVLNASKFSDPNTDIDVTITRRRDGWRATVADRGPGLPEGDHARLFAPFVRAEAARRSGKEGLGLGLAIVSSIVEAHAGTVGAEPRPGGGACFWIELPALSLEAARDLVRRT